MIELTKSYLRRVNCYHALNNLESAICLAEKQQMSYLEFAHYLFEKENSGRDQTMINKCLKQAKLPAMKTFDEFDYAYQQGITKQRVKEWTSFVWLEQRENIILMGPPGVGKTHAALALCYEAIKARYRVAFYNMNNLIEELLLADADGKLDKLLNIIAKNDLIVIDEMGYLPLKATSANLFFRLISHLYEFRSIIITSNRLFNEWGVTFNDNVIATAILDRLLHHAQPITLLGDSFRLKQINR
jgi:DNA replication protein DnaC